MKTAEQPATFDFLREAAEAPGARNYLFFAGGCLVLNFFVMAGDGREMIALFALLIAVPGLLARWSISACLYTITLGYQFFDAGRYGFYSRFAPNPLLLALGVLGYTLAQYRLLGFWKEVAPPRFRNRGAVAAMTEGPVKRPLENGREEEFYGFALQLALCAAGALALCVGIDDIAKDWSRYQKAPVDRPLGGFALFVAALAGSAVLFQLVCGFLERGTQSADRAYLTLADEFWNATRREQQRMDRWAKWSDRRARQRGGERL